MCYREDGWLESLQEYCFLYLPNFSDNLVYPTHDCQPTLLCVRLYKGSRGKRTSPTRKRNAGHPAPKTAFIVLPNVTQKARMGLNKQNRKKSSVLQSTIQCRFTK
ncbi:hypothetical protein AVEN_140941-1 [Araneus ventricosus]|uniref:Uncharacterized protein n=1 Tax=Araneus ventricosus TaxID=182803 RepID=A0A4Y2GBT2_ARAVE|nr:hypothetical protein AVEN_140941-1 [Araneus ventricosus]